MQCLAGVSQSAVLTIAYLMKAKKLSVTDARKLLKAKRPSICPSFRYIQLLQEYEVYLNTSTTNV